MNNKIGIRHEDKYHLERRSPLTPRHVKMLSAQGIEVFVEKSPQRIFSEGDYRRAGGFIAENLQGIPVIIGIKEINPKLFEENKTYIFFAHVIKGQPYNMPMLAAMMQKKCNLIDYEKITDEQGRRLIFFGRFAGLAGMINSLWSFGERMKIFGRETPFDRIRQTHTYDSLADAEQAVREAGEKIRAFGLPDDLTPFTIGFTGYGNVSKGAQHIANLLPAVEITPEELLRLKTEKKYSNRLVYKIIFKEHHLSRPINPDQPFELNHYYQHPEQYVNQFDQYLPHLSILMNCMYWDSRYPRIVTKDAVEKLYREGEMKLKVIGDITCDPDGSIEFTHKGTPIDDPVFVYNPITRTHRMGFQGEGILVMAVDILPSELPRESSESFGDALIEFIPSIVRANYNKPYDELELPPEIKKALILHKGELTPDFHYLHRYVADYLKD